MFAVGVGGGRVGVAIALVVLAVVLLGWLVARALRGSAEGPPHPAARAALDGALITAGGVAVLDNVVFHWLLAFHRFKDGWDGSIYVEVAGVVIGAALALTGFRSLRRRVASRPAGRSG